MNPPREVVRVDDGALTRARPPTSERWARAIAEHQHRVVMSLVALGLSLDRASDVANEAWARLMAKDRDGALTDLRLPGLAIVQARYLALDERRREALRLRHQQQAAGEAAVALVDAEPDPEERLLTRQQAHRALEAVSAAPVSAQRLMRLLYGQPAMAHAEAARALGLSVQRVRQILCELRKQVRAALEGDRS